MIDIAVALKQRQDKFVETRTIIETEVNQFLQSIAVTDLDVQEKCNYNPEASARTLLPALWQEPFDMAAYQQQLANFNNYVAGVKSVFDQINEEAVACLQS